MCFRIKSLIREKLAVVREGGKVEYGVRSRREVTARFVEDAWEE